MKLIFIHSREGPKMTMRNSHRKAIALLRMAGKKELWKVWPRLWEKVTHGLDEIFAQYTATHVVSSSIRDEWARANIPALTPLVAIDELMKIEDALAKKQAAPLEALQQVLSTKVGKVLYADEAASLAYRSYLQRIDTNVYELEMHNFQDSG